MYSKQVVIKIPDFTYNQLITLYKTILDADYTILSFGKYLTTGPVDKRYAILRHDVDRSIQRALDLAKIEHNLGIRSSYYFRYPSMFDPAIITAISGLGHEIGYHYEVLRKTGGDSSNAILLFEQELKEFRKVCPVKTICAHGSPLSPYDNLDLWNVYDFTRFDIDGDAQLSVRSPVSFFTDTGRSWDHRNNLRDSVANAVLTPGIRTTGDLISFISRTPPPLIYLVVHPERWTAGGLQWYLQYSRDCIFNAGKVVIRRFG
jgi:hypothetical protein